MRGMLNAIMRHNRKALDDFKLALEKNENGYVQSYAYSGGFFSNAFNAPLYSGGYPNKDSTALLL